jgi:hypothetical protein
MISGGTKVPDAGTVTALPRRPLPVPPGLLYDQESHRYKVFLDLPRDFLWSKYSPSSKPSSPATLAKTRFNLTSGESVTAVAAKTRDPPPVLRLGPDAALMPLQLELAFPGSRWGNTHWRQAVIPPAPCGRKPRLRPPGPRSGRELRREALKVIVPIGQVEVQFGGSENFQCNKFSAGPRTRAGRGPGSSRELSPVSLLNSTSQRSLTAG